MARARTSPPPSPQQPARGSNKKFILSHIEGRKKLILYFLKRTSKLALLIFLILASLGLFIGAYYANVTTIFGNVLLYGGVAVAVFAVILIIVITKRKPITERVFDQNLKIEIENEHKKVLDRLNLNIEDTKIMRSVSMVTPALFSGTIAIKQGFDKRVRYSKYAVTDLFFEKEMLFISKFIYDYVRGKVISETTREFFYKDIVSIGTSSFKHVYENFYRRKTKTNVQAIVIAVSGSDSVTIELGAFVLEGKFLGGFDQSLLNKVNEIKTMVRERRLASKD